MAPPRLAALVNRWLIKPVFCPRGSLTQKYAPSAIDSRPLRPAALRDSAQQAKFFNSNRHPVRQDPDLQPGIFHNLLILIDKYFL